MAKTKRNSKNATPAKPKRTGGAKSTKAEAKNEHFPIVGIGASAGGLEAVTQLLRSLPSHTGMAYVLVQHLDPTHESALTTILARATEMPVGEARHNVKLEPNQLYVIPPNKMMTMSNRRLRLSPRRDVNMHLPVDAFLCALAEAEGPHAIGVVLSGNGSDGTQGLLAIKAAGGITCAQDEKSAKYPGMPGSAIAAGCVDFIMPPDRLAKELAQLAGHPFVAPGPEKEPKATPSAEDEVFEDIITTLRHRMGVDFTHYKHATLRRRIQRRMVLHKYETLKNYADYVRSHSTEAKELYNDILIHVTGFFRDTTMFQALKRRVFPRLVKGRHTDQALRLWVPGCSTGEEVYSIAISLLEFMGDRGLHHTIQIFGTDINDTALERARAGVYPASIKTDVSAERLRRYFVKTEGGYRINKAVREMCIFARQNVVTDPPFSNIDLISCRNVLIYLGPTLQRRVMPLFHYALKPTGFLVLGASETTGGFADLFTLMDKKTKVYSKKATHIRPAVTFAHGLPETHTELGTASSRTEANLNTADVQKQADRIVLMNYGPAGVVINQHMELLQFRGHTGAFLEHAHGEASLHLLKMAREGLVLDLRTAVIKAIRQNARIRHEGIQLKQNGHIIEVNLEVIPFTVPPSDERFFMVAFEQVAPARQVGKEKRGAAKDRREPVENTELKRLREELASTRESLQAIIEEQEATNEELRSANEEIMSSNEELQSTNEELETAKEELQSTNEELTTLNDELESRNGELEQVNNDLYNLLASVNIPVVMVGPDLRIRRFTGIAEKTLNLIPSDVGRPITDINMPMDLPQLPKLVSEVIDNLTTKEVEVKCRRGHWWSVRVRPYRTTDNKIDGAVIAVVDINALKGSAEQIAQSRSFAEAVIDTAREPLLGLGQDLSVQFANGAFYNTFQVVPEETLHRRLYELGDGQWDVPELKNLLEDVLPHNSSFRDYEIEHEFPRVGLKKMRLNARRLLYNDNNGQLILLAIEDVTGKETP
jgi:two-component system CheB/CheR fusion protein